MIDVNSHIFFVSDLSKSEQPKSETCNKILNRPVSYLRKGFIVVCEQNVKSTVDNEPKIELEEITGKDKYEVTSDTTNKINDENTENEIYIIKRDVSVGVTKDIKEKCKRNKIKLKRKRNKIIYQAISFW